jgi:addiction module HigA family antidote
MTKNGMRPVHPGEILREEYLAPMGMSVHALSQALRVPSVRSRPILHCGWRATSAPMRSHG